MRRLLEFNMVSLDGYFEGPNHDISWHNVDDEFNEYAVSMLDSVGLLLFGRVTYELMAGYWPSAEGLRDDPVVAGRMNNLPKVVFSRTLEKAGWNNTELVKDDIGGFIKQMKQQPGKDMVILGSGSIVSECTRNGLIDEHRIMVNPVILGEGTPLFKGLNMRLGLKLLKTMTLKSGNVLFSYEPFNTAAENALPDVGQRAA